MPTVFISVRQCGNQVGSLFWEQVLNWNKTEAIGERHAVKKASSDYYHTPFVHHNKTLLWVMVDSEGKVIRSCLSKRVGPLVPLETG